MLLTAVHDIVRAQIDNPGPEAPPGSGSSTRLLRHLVWIHLFATVIAVVCWVQYARHQGVGRGRTITGVVVALVLGLASAGAGLVLGAGLD